MLKLATQRDARFDVDDRELQRERQYLHLRHARGDPQGARPRTAARVPRGHRRVREDRHVAPLDRALRPRAFRGRGARQRSRLVRPGAGDDSEATPGRASRSNPRELAGAPAGKIMTFCHDAACPSPRPRSARSPREGASIRYLTPDPVADYIRTHGTLFDNEETHRPSPRRSSSSPRSRTSRPTTSRPSTCARSPRSATGSWWRAPTPRARPRRSSRHVRDAPEGSGRPRSSAPRARKPANGSSWTRATSSPT